MKDNVFDAEVCIHEHMGNCVTVDGVQVRLCHVPTRNDVYVVTHEKNSELLFVYRDGRNIATNQQHLIHNETRSYYVVYSTIEDDVLVFESDFKSNVEVNNKVLAIIDRLHADGHRAYYTYFNNTSVFFSKDRYNAIEFLNIVNDNEIRKDMLVNSFVRNLIDVVVLKFPQMADSIVGTTTVHDLIGKLSRMGYKFNIKASIDSITQ